VLTVACSSASWAQELTMRRAELLERLLARAPDTAVTALRFSVGDHVAAPPPEAPPPRPAPPAPTPAQTSLGARAAEGLADERLRDLVARAAAASAARRTASKDR
jgi:hypothetical protein